MTPSPSLTAPLLPGQLGAHFDNPLAASSVIVVADWAAAAADGAPAPADAPPIRAAAAHRFGCDLCAAALAHAAAFWGLFLVASVAEDPALTLAACLTYHLAAVATGAALLAAASDAAGLRATRHAGVVAVLGALFCVQWGACSYLFWRAGSAVWCGGA